MLPVYTKQKKKEQSQELETPGGKQPLPKTCGTDGRGQVWWKWPRPIVVMVAEAKRASGHSEHRRGPVGDGMDNMRAAHSQFGCVVGLVVLLRSVRLAIFCLVGYLIGCDWLFNSLFASVRAFVWLFVWCFLARLLI